MKKRIFILVMIIVLSVSGFVASPSTNGQRGLVNTLSPGTLGFGRIAYAAYTVFGSSATYEDKIVASSALSDYFQSTNHIGIAYGLNDFIDINIKYSLAVDYRHIERNSDDKSDTYVGSNNLQIGLKYQFLKANIFEMGIHVYTHLPVARRKDGNFTLLNDSTPYRQRNFSDELLYNDKPEYGAQLLAGIGKERVRTYLNLGYILRHSDLISDVFTLYSGIEFNLDEITTIFGEFNSEFFTSHEKIKPMRLGGGLRFNMPHEIQLTTGAFAGLNPEASDWQVFLGLSHSAIIATLDSDNDGIPDDKDKCPKEPEDMDGFEDEDGCPDNDNDKDGILDPQDRCPSEAEDMDGFEDEDGCPDNDNDGDGIPDSKDKCPNDAEDIDGFEDEDGCPESDNDKDGIPDSKDKCPNDAEDMDGFEDEDGCPDNDNDGDNIPDSLDKCPNEAETVNDFEDEDGCPDAVILKKNERIVLDNIYFKSGSSELMINSFPSLDRVKKIFTDNPKIIIQIEGHTDSRGKAAYNLKLSQKRAESVRSYLVDKLGVKPDRVKAVGLGEQKPIASNKTRKGRAQNRRIEFKVLSNE